MESLRKKVLLVQPILWQNISRFFDRSSISSSIASQGWTFLCKHKKLARHAFYSSLELGMLILDQFPYRKWGFPLAYFLLSAFVSIVVSYDHYNDRIAAETKTQSELQLGELEVSVSLLQSADTLTKFIVTAWSGKFEFRFLFAFPLVFCLHTLVHHVRKDYIMSSNDLLPMISVNNSHVYGDSASSINLVEIVIDDNSKTQTHMSEQHELSEAATAQEDHRDPPENQSMPVSTSVRDDEAEATVMSINNSHASCDSASITNPIEIFIDDNSKTQTHMSAKQLHRRFSHKHAEMAQNIWRGTRRLPARLGHLSKQSLVTLKTTGESTLQKVLKEQRPSKQKSQSKNNVLSD